MTPLIHLDNVSIRHDEHVVLEHLSTEVNEGELVYLIGKGMELQADELAAELEAEVHRALDAVDAALHRVDIGLEGPDSGPGAGSPPWRSGAAPTAPQPSTYAGT